MASLSRRSRRGMGMTNRGGQSSSSELAATSENDQAPTPTRKAGMAAQMHESKLGGMIMEEGRPEHVDSHSPQKAVANRSSNCTPHCRSGQTPDSKKSHRSKSRGGHDIKGWHRQQVGKKLEQAKRDFLHKKVAKMYTHLRQSFVAADNDGNAQLDKEEVTSMLKDMDSTLTQDELTQLEDFVWSGDKDGDERMSFEEFRVSLKEFEEQLKIPNAKADSFKAFTVLHSSGLLKKVFDHRQELMQILQQVAQSEGYKNVTHQEFLQALKKMQGVRVTAEEAQCISKAANTFAQHRFSPARFMEEAGRLFGEYSDLENANFGKRRALGVEKTTLEQERVYELRQRALQKRAKAAPVLEQLKERMTTKVGGSIGRAFRAMDYDKSGVLDAQKLQTAAKHFNLELSRSEAQDLVDSCDINGDGLVSLLDFQELIAEHPVTFVELDQKRTKEASLWANGSMRSMPRLHPEESQRATPTWGSQFEQGQWSGPFAVEETSSCFLPPHFRWYRSLVPQLLDPRIAESWQLATNPVSPPGIGASPEDACQVFYMEKERQRAARVVEEAKKERKNKAESRLDDLFREKEEKMRQREEAKMEHRRKAKEDWVIRVDQANDFAERPHGKGYCMPKVRHAFHAPTLGGILP